MIDVYSLCPGGTGKKIKFCCRSRVEDFRRIYKFLDANQNTACLNFIDRLQKTDPDCACLTAIRCVILKSLPNREQELIETAKRFYELYPDNPIAIAESAQAIFLEGQRKVLEKYGTMAAPLRSSLAIQERDEMRAVIREAILRFEKAFSVPHPFQYEQVIFKLELFVKSLIKVGFYESANAWMGMVLDMNLNTAFQEMFVSSLHHLKTSRAIPLCFRIGTKIMKAPADVPWRERFDGIVQDYALKLRWTQAVAEFQALAEEIPAAAESKEYWFDLALIHEWLCDLDSAAKYWERYLQFEDVSFYSALERQIHLSFFKECPLEDSMDICTLEFPLSSAKEVQEKLLAEPTFRLVQELNRYPLENGTLLAAFDVLDSPAPTSLEGVDVEDIPVVVGNAILWENPEEESVTLAVINVLQGGTAFVTEAVKEILSPWIAGEVQQSVTRRISVTLDSILRKIAIPEGLSEEEIRNVKNEHCRLILLKRWINFPLGILKNQSMRSAARKPQLRRRVETVFYVLRHLLEREKLDLEILTELRGELELDSLPEITPEILENLSPMFYDNLKAELLTPERMERVFFLLRMFNIGGMSRKILENAADSPDYSPALRIEILKMLWSQNPQTGTSLEIIKKGRELCRTHGLDDVFFDIMEIAYAINEGKFQTAFDKIKHIRQTHANDEEAMQYIAQLSQYMYGMAKQMNPSTLTAQQKKAMFAALGNNYSNALDPKMETLLRNCFQEK